MVVCSGYRAVGKIEDCFSEGRGLVRTRVGYVPFWLP